MQAILTINLIVHNDYSHIHYALTSIIENTSCPLTIYITINTGTSDEFIMLKQAFPDVHYIVNDEPKGFAANHNAILKIAKTPYVALLNDDIELAPHAIDILIDYLEKNSSVGVVSPRIINPDGTPQLTTYSYPSLPRMIYKISGLGYLTRQGSQIRNFIINSGIARLIGVESLNKNETTRIVPVVVGVAMFARREAYQQVGILDEDTLVYGEEVAWHWRMNQAGWKVAVIADTYIIHYNVDKDLRGWQLAEHRKGMLNFFCRYRPKWQVRVLRLVMIVFHSLRWLFNLFFDRQRAEDDCLSIIVALKWQPSPEASGANFL
jgi:hypothetical protein